MNERITVSLPEETLADARAAVEAGQASSLSAYVAQTLQNRLDRERKAAAITDILGQSTADEIAWAKQKLGIVDGETQKAS
ncbi:Arc/MetJ-type ribon-helix-helix transcriptional regulator [Spinactinospora alkalitolerans]|uniref:Arc/MetJ-type ribon-helix-helix transcriptional regulator n=1 Tax=Spinactinospora alkalitolerans TaxID=687207 RepID=A0A852TVS7_9ACTN|nr:hypothetical protein [Spinactinospora alkalitolerans]NYE47407.1 Arc/MetJ-type ribon-helix-helix transcriptional regulator [Spinactinospora alkalitolerans]